MKDVSIQKSMEGGVLLASSADEEGVVRSKLDPVPGGSGSIASALSGSVIQALGAVDAGGAHMDWAEECEAGDGVNIALDHIATSASVSKVNLKGKALPSSK